MRKHPLIFVVDDDFIILKLIDAELKSAKMDVMSFSYGEDCLPELHLNPDLIILDYIFVKGNKSVLSGLEILQEIRKTKPDVPVIILSGQDSGSAVLELIKLGIEEYIIKEENFVSKLKEEIVRILQNE
jgi:two-component system, NtrC family, response regulator AtoC